MSQVGAKYETRGSLYLIQTMKGSKFIIGLGFEDYEKLLPLGFKDEEVILTIKKAEYGPEYAQQVPEHRMRAGLYTIQMEGRPKFQIGLDVQTTEELLKRGFKDLDKVALIIEKSPFRVPAEPLKPEELKYEF